jgi:hypothetical protein
MLAFIYLSLIIGSTSGLPTKVSEGLSVESTMSVQRRMKVQDTTNGAGGPRSEAETFVQNLVVFSASSAGGTGSGRILSATTQLTNSNLEQVKAEIRVSIGAPVDTMTKTYIGRIFVRTAAMSISSCEDRVSRNGAGFLGAAQLRRVSATLSSGAQEPVSGRGRRLFEDGEEKDPCDISPLPQDICQKMKLKDCGDPGQGLGGEQVCKSPISRSELESAMRAVDDKIEEKSINTAAHITAAGISLVNASARIAVLGDRVVGFQNTSTNIANIYDREVLGSLNQTEDTYTEVTELTNRYKELTDDVNASVHESAAAASRLYDESLLSLMSIQGSSAAQAAALAAVLEHGNATGQAVDRQVVHLNSALRLGLEKTRTISRLISNTYRDTNILRAKVAKLEIAKQLLATYNMRVFESACDPPLAPKPGGLPVNMDTTEQAGIGDEIKRPFLTLVFTYATESPGRDLRMDYDVVHGGRYDAGYSASFGIATGGSIDNNKKGTLPIGAYSSAASADGPLVTQQIYVNKRRLSFFGDNQYLLENRERLQSTEDILAMIGPPGCTATVNCNVWAVVERQRCLGMQGTGTSPVDAMRYTNQDPENPYADVGIGTMPSDMDTFCHDKTRADSSRWFSATRIIREDGKPVPGQNVVGSADSITGRWQLETITTRSQFQGFLRDTCSVEVLEIPSAPGPQAPLARWFSAKSSTFMAPRQGQTDPNAGPTTKIIQSLGTAGAGRGGIQARCAVSGGHMQSQSTVRTGDLALGMTLPFWVNSQLQVATTNLHMRVQVLWEIIRHGSLGRETDNIDLPFFVRDDAMASDATRYRDADLESYYASSRLPFSPDNPPPVRPPPVVQRCGVSTIAVHGVDMVPVYQLLYKDTVQTARVSIVINGTVRHSKDLSVRRTRSIAGSIASSAVVAGFVGAITKAGGAYENNPLPRRSGENFCFDTGPGVVTASRNSDVRCHRPDYLMMFEDTDEHGMGVGTADSALWQERRSRAWYSPNGTGVDPVDYPPPFMGPISVDHPAGLPGTTRVFGADQWHHQEGRRVLETTCASASLMEYRRQVVVDRRLRRDAPTMQDPNDPHGQLVLDKSRADPEILASPMGAAAYERGGLRCTSEDMALGGTDAGFWCSTLDTHVLDVGDTGVSDPDSLPELSFVQKEWTAQFSMYLPGGVLTVGDSTARTCPLPSNIRIETPHEAQAQLVVRPTDSLSAAGDVIVTVTVSPRRANGDVVLPLTDAARACTLTSIRTVHDGEAMMFPLPFCEDVTVTVTAASAPLGLDSNLCWQWDGNLTSLWDRTSSAIPYTGQIDRVGVIALQSASTGPTAFGPQTRVGVGALNEGSRLIPTVDVVTVGDLGVAARVHAIASVGATTYHTVAVLHEAVKKMRGVLETRMDDGLMDPNLPPPVDYRESMARAAMDSTNMLVWLRASLATASGTMAAEVAAVDTVATKVGERIAVFIEQAKAQKKLYESTVAALAVVRANFTKVSGEFDATRGEFLDRMDKVSKILETLDQIEKAQLPSLATMATILAQDPEPFGPSFTSFQIESEPPIFGFLRDVAEFTAEVLEKAYEIAKTAVKCTYNVAVGDLLKCGPLKDIWEFLKHAGSIIVAVLLSLLGFFILVALIKLYLACRASNKASQSRPIQVTVAAPITQPTLGTRKPHPTLNQRKPSQKRVYSSIS